MVVEEELASPSRVSSKQIHRKRLSLQAAQRGKEKEETKRAADNDRQREAARLRQAAMTPEQRSALSARRKARRSAMTPEQKEQERNRMRAYRSRFSEDKKAEVRARNRGWHAKRA
jgi:hypothetical protein